MPQNAYGTAIAGASSQTTDHAQAVIDTAIVVWMQMGLTEDQILYGIAMMNVESGYNPVVRNNVDTDSIRGLGQFNTATWNATEVSFDKQFGILPGPKTPFIANSDYNPASPQGTNAQAGASNDSAAGVYDPNGLVTQLEVVGTGILKEWRAATSSKEQAAAQALLADGARGAAILVPNSSANSQLLSMVALAYLNHHEGSGWWTDTLTKDGITYFQQTANKLKTPKSALAVALQGVVTGVQNELSYLLTQVPNPTATPSDLLRGDPWTLANAFPSVSEGDPSAPVDISHDIPSIFPTIDNFYSQTAGGLTSYVVNTVKYGPVSNPHTSQVSYTYTSAGTKPLDVVSGSANYNFSSKVGGGTETLGNGDTLTYTIGRTGTVQSSEYNSSGALIQTESDTYTLLSGIESISDVYGDGSEFTGQLAYINQATLFETEGTYDSQGRLITATSGSATAAVTEVKISTSDPNYAEEAAALALAFDVPEVDTNVLRASNPLLVPNSTTLVNSQGDTTAGSDNSAAAGAANPDPGFQLEAMQANGNTLRWSLNVDGTVASRDIVDSSGNSTSQDFDSAGSYIGTSTSSVNSDGSVVTQLYDTQGNSTGSKTTTSYGAGTTITINGVATTYANGCTITNEYGPTGSGPALEFTISSTVQNADGTYTTTEVSYQPLSNSNGSITDQLIGTTVTDVNGNDSTSTDYDASGNVTGSRDLVTSSDGSTTVERFGASGTLLGSNTLSVDNQGDIILQSYDPTGTLTDSKDLSPGGVLTDSQYQSGSLSGVVTSTATADGGNLATYTDPSGTVTGDQWELSNGAYGSDTVQAGGSIAGTSHFTDSSSSSSVNDGSGHISTTNYNAVGSVTGTTTTVVQGGSITSQFTSVDSSVSSSATVQADGSMQATVAPASRVNIAVALDTSDNLTWTAGASDGATTVDVVDSNGDLTGTSVTSVATDGSVTVTDFDPTGAETGYSQTSTSDGVTTTTQYTDTNGVFTESGYTQTVVNADSSVTTTDYTITSGVSSETGYSDTVTNANGGATTTSYALDTNGVLVESGMEVVSADSQGHVTTAEYDGGGDLTGYILERTDSSGDVLITQYASDDTELRSTTIEASGVVSDVVFDSSNGTVTTTWQTDGSYQQTTDDGEGDVTTTNYAASGAPESDTWTQSDGSSGQDTVNADGSGSSISNDGQGNLTTTTVSASGAVTSVTDYYDHGPLTAVPDTDEASWDLRGSTGVDTSADGLTTTTSNYSGSGQLLGSQSVVASDGGSTTTTSNFDGSGNRLNFNTVVTSTDGLTVTTTDCDGSGDTLGSTVVTTSADGDTVSTSTYKGSGNLVGTTTNVTSADGLTVTVSDYDASGDLLDYQTQVTSTDGSTLTTSDYSGSGQLQGSTVAVTSSDGLTVTTSTYDGSQNLLGISVAVSSSDGSTTSTTNYNADNVMTGETVVAQVSQNGTVTSTYDASGNLLSEQIAFTGDVEPGNLAISATAINGVPSLVLNGPTDSVTVTGGLVGSVAAVTSLTFDVGASLSLVQLVQQAAALGNVQATTLSGVNGNWIFDPSNGDTLTGGSGQDTLSAWGNEQTVTAGPGGDLVYAEGSDDVVNGGVGTDTLEAFGADTTSVGGLGNETFDVNDGTEVIQAQAGAASNTIFSTVSYTLPTSVDTLTLQGSANLTATGNSGAANLITANSGNDSLIAGSGTDTLISGSGIDTLIGGQGPDTFLVNNAADEVELPYGGSRDTVVASVSYTLTQAVGSLTLAGSSALMATDGYGYAQITGNAGNDTLVGGSGADTLTTGSGVDTVVTGTGRNTLIINNTADVIEVSAGASNDTVESSVSYALQTGLDTLLLTGGSNIEGQGNDDATNSITGNSGNDLLIAGSGADTLMSGSGIDTLVAGAGTDYLVGHNAGDTYELNPGFGTTQINLSSGSGAIQFGAGISAADLSVSTVVDAQGNLALQITDGNSVVTLDDGMTGGLTEFGLPGDALSFQFGSGPQLNFAQFLAAVQVEDSTLAGASGNLILSGDAGASLSGGTGNDTIIGSGAGDTIVAGSGNQALYGYGSGDVLAGGDGADTLYGCGNDTLAAGSGDTILYGGSGTNTYILTQGGSSTLYTAAGATGLQTIYLPAGMTLTDFDPTVEPNGDLVLQSASGDTTAIIKGLYSGSSSVVWQLADQNGNSQLLKDWVSTAATSGSGSGGSGPTAYELEVQALLQEYEANLSGTLKQAGARGGTLSDPDGSSNANDYHFSGISTQNVTVQGGYLHVASSESDQTQTTVTQTGTRTEVYSEPTYSTVSTPGSVTFVQAGDANLTNLEQEGYSVTPTTVNGETGYAYYNAPQSATVQTGTRAVSVTIPVLSSYTTETQGFTDYNITGDGGNDSISADPQFVGTVVTGNGDVNVDLGSDDSSAFYLGHYTSPDPLPLGAFIDVGNGNDYIVGTGGADTITAGYGNDTILASLGSTIYVPMAGGTTDYIDVDNAPFYGSGPFPQSTLVLPEGVTPGDLAYQVLPGASFVDTSDYAASDLETLELSYGSASVLVAFQPGPPSHYLTGADSDDTDGITQFEFADGTVLTRAQMLAIAASGGGARNEVYRATAADQSVEGSTSAPDTLIGGYAGDTLIGASGQDTFEYSLSGGAEEIAEVGSSGSENNTLQFGAGINPSALSITVTDSSDVVLDVGGNGDSIELAGFNPANLLGSMPVQQFQFAGGTSLSWAQLLNQLQPSSVQVSTSDGGTTDLTFGNQGYAVYTAYAYNAAGQNTVDYVVDPDGSTDVTNYTYNSDGSATFTEVVTPPDGGTPTSVSLGTTDTQGNVLTYDTTYADGSTDNTTSTYNADGSFSSIEVVTPADRSGATTTVTDYNAGYQVTSMDVTNPDGSTQDATNSYNADGSYIDTLVTSPAGGGAATTTVTNYDSAGNQVSENVYTPSPDGAYTDSWQNQDGSNGSYWWSASTREYQETWQDSNGASWTDDYQYAAGGSPGSTGVSFTETYTDSAGDQGTRQYNATTGVTSLTWDSSTTGMLTGTTTDSGFIGLQNDGELTNTQQDPSFFNPTVSPAFQSFLAAH